MATDEYYKQMKKWLASFEYEVMPVNTPVAILRLGDPRIPVDHFWEVFDSAYHFSKSILGLKYSRGKTYTSDGKIILFYLFHAF